MSEVSSRLYLGRLPHDVLREDITDLFRGLGRIVDVRILNGFGFVEFDDPRDAELAVRDFDGTMFMGDRIIVQFAKQPRRREERGGRDRDRDPYGGPRGYDRYDARPPRRGPRRGLYRIIVFNLPPGTSWQDLKDVGREHGQVIYSDINPARPDEGALEFDYRDDYERALAKIEGTELRGAILRAEPDGEPPSERERSPLPDARWRDGDAYPPRESDRWSRDTRPPPPMRDERDYRDEREPLPPRDDDRELPPPRDDPASQPPDDAQPPLPAQNDVPAPAEDAPAPPPAETASETPAEPPADTPAEAPPAEEAGTHEAPAPANA